MTNLGRPIQYTQEPSSSSSPQRKPNNNNNNNVVATTISHYVYVFLLHVLRCTPATAKAAEVYIRDGVFRFSSSSFVILFSLFGVVLLFFSFDFFHGPHTQLLQLMEQQQAQQQHILVLLLLQQQQQQQQAQQQLQMSTVASTPSAALRECSKVLWANNDHNNNMNNQKWIEALLAAAAYTMTQEEANHFIQNKNYYMATNEHKDDNNREGKTEVASADVGRLFLSSFGEDIKRTRSENGSFTTIIKQQSINDINVCGLLVWCYHAFTSFLLQGILFYLFLSLILFVRKRWNAKGPSS